MAENDISFFDKLRQVIRYDPEIGKLFWLERPRSLFPTDGAWKSWNTRYAGTEALTTNERGYKSGNLLGKSCYAHRVAWALTHGVWPEEIDHINQDRSDNRLHNLRDAGHVLNLRNMPMKKNNTSGVTGVYFSRAKGVWTANIGNATKSGKNLGRFAVKEDAIKARKAAEIALGYHPNHGR